MMKYAKVRRYVFLIPLHVWGFISIPNYHRHTWMNKLHNLVYKKLLYMAFMLSLALQHACTFVYAIHDLPEFLQRLFESVLVVTCVVDLVFYNFKYDEITELFDLQEKVFKVSDKKIHRKYLTIEFFEVGVFFACSIFSMVGILSETFLPVSERNLYLMSTVYRRKYPDKILPLNFWTPSFIDPSEMPYFVLFYLFEVYAVAMVLTVVFERLFILASFPTSLLGQYKMLAELVKLIGVELKDNAGENIFYTDIAHGTYISETQLLNLISNDMPGTSKQDMALKLKRWAKKDYPDFYLKQIIKRHQELDHVMVKYTQYSVSYYNLLILLCLVLWLLAFYQLAYMLHLSIFNFFKIIMEFIFTFLSYVHFNMQSERLTSCNESIARALGRCGWYNCSPAVRRKICIFVNSVRRPRQFCLFGNSLEMSKPHLISVLKMAFSFINFMQLQGPL